MMLSVGIALFFGPSDLFAFDYLEHSYNTDLACDRAQTMLIEEFASTPYDPAREIRFLALSLYCPTEKTTT